MHSCWYACIHYVISCYSCLIAIEYCYAPSCPGLLVAAQRTEQCSLRFRLHPNDLLNPRYRAVFTGLTPEELVANSNINIGPRLICDCTVEGLTQRHWLDIYGNVLPTDRDLVVDYRARLPDEQPGTAVILRINKNRFSCTDAGTYTCIIGSNSRTLLVTPYGRWSGSYRVIVMGAQWQHNYAAVVFRGVPVMQILLKQEVCLGIHYKKILHN